MKEIKPCGPFEKCVGDAALAVEAAQRAEQDAAERCIAEPLDSPDLERLRAAHVRALNALDELTGGR